MLTARGRPDTLSVRPTPRRSTESAALIVSVLRGIHALPLLLFIGCSVSACGSGSPATPSQPQFAQMAGVWTESLTVTGIFGGECVGADLQASIGSVSQLTFVISQSGSDLTATSTSQAPDGGCSWSGTAGTNTVTLNVTSCQTSVVIFRCGNGAARDVRLMASGVTAIVNGNVALGTEADSYNVLVSTTQAGVGVLTINGSVTMSR